MGSVFFCSEKEKKAKKEINIEKLYVIYTKLKGLKRCHSAKKKKKKEGMWVLKE